MRHLKFNALLSQAFSLKNVRNLILASAAVALTAPAVTAGVYRHVGCKSEGLTLVADSIDCRRDLTRLYGRLLGMAHTSQRLDSLTLKTESQTLGATDIDGVDFKRWFQWEEDGEIPVEIDFPKMRPGRTATIEAVTPRGTALWVLTIEP